MATAPLAPATSVEPDGAPRIAVLDIMRGIAILGILFMNINDMGRSLAASMGGNVSLLGWSPLDQFAWWLREILANGTARCLLEMLFGAGMVILTDRFAAATERRWPVLRRYWWRNLVLLGFGLVHMFVLMWPGEILHTYAIASMAAVLFRRLPPRWLITIGLAGAFLQLLGGGVFGYYTANRQIAQTYKVELKRDAGEPLTAADRKLLADAKKGAERRAKAKADQAKDVAREDAARSGTSRAWFAEQVKQGRDWLTEGNEVFAVIESITVMLIGAGLFKLGVLQGLRSRRFYLWLMTLGYLFGGAMRTLGAWEQTRFESMPHASWGLYEFGRQAMTLGHVGAINLIVTTVIGARLLRPFVAAGRTALSIYIAQTLVCLWVLFPPFGLGLYGRLTWMPLMLTALGVNIVLLVGANLWVRHFAIAPVEWAWRSIVERRRLPFRRHGCAAVVGGRTVTV